MPIDKKTTASPADQVSGAVYQLAKLYELWMQDRTELAKRVSQLETQGERLEHVLEKFSTVDKALEKSFQHILQKEVNQLSESVGHKVGSAASNSAQASLVENTRQFRIVIANAEHAVDNIVKDLHTWSKWTYALIFSLCFLAAMISGAFIHYMTKDYRLTEDEAFLINQGKVYWAAHAHLTDAEKDRIKGLAFYGKEYEKIKNLTSKTDKKTNRK